MNEFTKIKKRLKMNELDIAVQAISKEMGPYIRIINPGRLNCINYYKMAAAANGHPVYPQQYLLDESANIGMNSDTLQDRIPWDLRVHGSDIAEATGISQDLFTTADNLQHGKVLETILPRNYKQFRSRDNKMYNDFVKSRHERKLSLKNNFENSRKHYKLTSLTLSNEKRARFRRIHEDAFRMNPIY